MIKDKENENLEDSEVSTEITLEGTFLDNIPEESTSEVHDLVNQIEEDVNSGKSNEVQLSDIDISNIQNLSAQIADELKDVEGLTQEQLIQYIKYIYGNRERPTWAEKMLSDGSSRITEFNMITSLRSIESLPMIETLINTLTTSVVSDLPRVKFMSITDKMAVLKEFMKIKKDILANSRDYTKLEKNIQSLPLIYRQLLDELFKVPSSKIDRLKMLPKIIDLSDEQWARVTEITNMK